MNTRRQTNHRFFTSPATLPSLQLPTYFDIGRLYLHLQCVHESSEVVNELAKQVIGIWHKASIPTTSLKSIGNKLKRFFEKVKLALRSSTRKNNEAIGKILPHLFDVAACVCPINIISEHEASVCCHCPKIDKVSRAELFFLMIKETNDKCSLMQSIVMLR